MADVLNYLVRLADKLDVNLLEAAREKIEAQRAEIPGGQGARQREEVLGALKEGTDLFISHGTHRWHSTRAKNRLSPFLSELWSEAPV